MAHGYTDEERLQLAYFCGRVKLLIDCRNQNWIVWRKFHNFLECQPVLGTFQKVSSGDMDRLVDTLLKILQPVSYQKLAQLNTLCSDISLFLQAHLYKDLIKWTQDYSTSHTLPTSPYIPAPESSNSTNSSLEARIQKIRQNLSRSHLDMQ